MNEASQRNTTSLQERLAQVRRRLECAWVSERHDEAHVLRRRAKLLETSEIHADQVESTLDLVQFSLGQETYACELILIDRVIPWRECLRLPTNCRHFAGMLDGRGEMLAVFDLRSYFLFAEQEFDPAEYIVVIEYQNSRAGFCIDALEGVLRISSSDLKPAPLNPARRGQPLMLGVTGDGLIVLDGRKLPEHPDFIIE